MPKALATAAERWPSLPRPRMPSVRPSRSGPMVVCQDAPALRRACSKPMRRVSSSIRPKAMPVVGEPTLPVPQTVDAALGRGLQVEGIVAGAGGDQELEVRQRLDHGAREGGALAHADDDGEALQRLDGLVAAGEGLVEDLDFDVFGDGRPVGKRQRHILVVVEDGGPDHVSALVPGGARRPPGGARLGRSIRKERGASSPASGRRAWRARPVPVRACSAAPAGTDGPRRA